MQVREKRKSYDTDEAAPDIQGISEDAIRIRVECAPQDLSQADKHQRDQNEEYGDDCFYRHRELRDVRVAVFGTEENFLRRCLTADIDDESRPDLIDRQRGERRAHRSQPEQGKGSKPIATLASGHAAARHAKKAGKQYDVCEELQKNHVGGKPTNARQFQKQHQKANQEKIDTVHSDCVRDRGDAPARGRRRGF